METKTIIHFAIRTCSSLPQFASEKMYEDRRQHSTPHHIFTSLLAVWKCDKAWFLLGATTAKIIKK